jgi:glucosyl-dolichyl phosphate glucuronosyltransferase
MQSAPDVSPDVSVVICTYNRGPLLRVALQHVAAQELGDLRFEVWIINNNSSDDTQQVIDEFITGRANWHTFFEARQGLSYARNSGIERARAPIVAFTDDDIAVRPDWIAQIARTMREHPEIDYVGGKVLPRWHAPPPKWLSPLNWIPLAITDHGDEPFYVSSSRPWCLVGANLAVRTSTLLWAGGFNPDFQRVKDGIGSTEDHEFQFRLWRDGRLGLYAPNVVVEAEVQEDRHRKSYHRKWHAGHARYCARMGTESISEDMPELFGMPACYLRSMAMHGAGWLASTVHGRPDRAFVHENKIRFLINYVQQYHVDTQTNGMRHTLRRTARGVRELVRRKLSVGARLSELRGEDLRAHGEAKRMRASR